MGYPVRVAVVTAAVMMVVVRVVICEGWRHNSYQGSWYYDVPERPHAVFVYQNLDGREWAPKTGLVWPRLLSGTRFEGLPQF